MPRRTRTLSEDSRDRCNTRAALLETEIAYIQRGDHLAEETDATADKAGWIPLRDLRPGATFETQDGGRFLKTADSKGALCVCYDLEHGQRSAGNVGASLVREIKV